MSYLQKEDGLYQKQIADFYSRISHIHKNSRYSGKKKPDY